MIPCRRCQSENREGRRFCARCGSVLALSCRSCGFVNEPGEDFCGGCGAVLVSSVTDAAPDVLEHLVASPGALDDERKDITVLFADMKGSMELLADRDPEDARALLDPVLQCMIEAVHQYDGTVNQVMGDGIMALFGAPVALEDHAIRACYAALRMHEQVARYVEAVKRASGVPVQIRVGINSGDVVVRSIRNDLTLSYSAVGQTTHLAARMEQAAGAGTTLITGETFRRARDFVRVNAVGRLAVRGLDVPVEAYELLGPGTARSRLHAAALAGLTPFVGRDDALDQLHRALGCAKTGAGQVVAIAGEPGIGKSRLLWEFVRAPATSGWLMLESGAAAYDAGVYSAVRELLRAYFQIAERDDGRKIREKVCGKLMAVDEAAIASLPALLRVFGVPHDDPDWHALDRAEQRRRTLGAIAQVFVHESHVQPVIVVVEDLHVTDSETRAFLDRFVGALSAARILLIVNYRPGYDDGWTGKPHYTRLDLEPLSGNGADALARALIGPDPRLDPLKRLLIDRTAGNPLFLEETVRTLAETGALIGERGAYHVAGALGEVRIPPTVQAVLTSRIDRLAPEHKRLLQSAAVIGPAIPVSLLAATLEMSEAAVRHGLTHLRMSGFIDETRLFPDLEYAFHHALTHEVAYASLLRESRRALHGRILAAMEALDEDRRADHVERLAHHARRAELWDKAVIYLRDVGAKCAGHLAYREAAQAFEEALDALGHLPECPDATERALDLRLDLRNALYPLGEQRRILEHLETAEALAERVGDRRRLALVFIYRASQASVGGHPDRVIEASQRALAIAELLGDVPLAVMAKLRLAQAYDFMGDYAVAVSTLRSVIASLDRDPVANLFGEPGLPSVISRVGLVYCLAEQGDFADGEARATEALRIAGAAGHLYSTIAAYLVLGYALLRQGDLDRAITALEACLEPAKVERIPAWVSTAAVYLAYVYALGGRHAEADAALRSHVAPGHVTGSASWASYVSEVYRLAGRMDEALTLAMQARDFARARQARGREAHALYALAEVVARRAGAETARELYDDAMMRARDLGMRPLVAHCHRALGELNRRTGDRDDALRHRAAAGSMYRAMSMSRWLAQVEASVADDCGP